MNVSSRFDVAGFGVIVTGGASGLGLAYGEVLAAHGARVTLIDVDGDAVAAQASRLQDEGLDVRGAVADVTDHAALDRVIDEAAAAVRPARRRVRQRRHRSRRRLRRRLGGRRAAAGRGGRARALHRRALEPRDRHQPQRDLRHRARRGPPHAPAPVRTDHRHDVARRDQGRARDRRRLHGGEGRRQAPHALASRSNSPPTASPSTRSRPGSSSPTSAAATRTTPTCRRRSRRTFRCIASACPDDIKALALFLASPASRVHHRAGDRDRRRLGARGRRLSRSLYPTDVAVPLARRARRMA